jgi:hypothetical protein
MARRGERRWGSDGHRRDDEADPGRDTATDEDTDPDERIPRALQEGLSPGLVLIAQVDGRSRRGDQRCFFS